MVDKTNQVVQDYFEQIETAVKREDALRTDFT